MVKKIKGNTGLGLYVFFYAILLIIEMVYVVMVWTPYGRVDGNMRSWYTYVRQHLDTFVILSIVVIALYNTVFPGLGIWALTITLYRVSQLCCGPTKEMFGDGIPFAWGSYEPDNATLFDQGELERNNGASHSSALHDNENGHRSIRRLRNMVAVFPKDGCGWDNWIIPKIREVKYYHGKKRYDGYCGCESCKLSVYGSLFQTMVSPRPLYTTSLIAKQMKES